MQFCRKIDKTQLFNLLTGMAGIYVIYFIAGIIHQSIIKKQYINVVTKVPEKCQFPFGLTFIPMIVAWIMGWIYVKWKVEQPVNIPHKNAALTGLAATSAAFFSLMAIKETSYPVVMMMESSSILPVIFVAVFCSRVVDQRLKLGPKKIIVALIITVGILLFQFADPSNKERQQKQQLLGLVFVLGFFVADGFLPDLQAEIKTRFKPQPVEMMAEINKWGAFYMLIGMTISGNIIGFGIYMIQHPLFSYQLLAMSIISGFGQFFVYRMIKQFKQHFVPFTITSRKILTVTLSIIVYKHETNFLQIIGIIIVLLTVCVEFFLQISKPVQQAKPEQINYDLNEQIPYEQELKGVQNKSDDGNGAPIQLRSSIQAQNQQQQQNNNNSALVHNNYNADDQKQRSIIQENKHYNQKNHLNEQQYTKKQ